MRRRRRDESQRESLRGAGASNASAVAAQESDVTLGAESPGALGWARAACVVCARPSNLRRTLPIALVVGVVLTAINQADVIASGNATATTWLKCALNFVVPFIVSNLGLLSGRSRGT
jgi:hypothetical protein